MLARDQLLGARCRSRSSPTSSPPDPSPLQLRGDQVDTGLAGSRITFSALLGMGKHLLESTDISFSGTVHRDTGAALPLVMPNVELMVMAQPVSPTRIDDAR